MKNKSPNEDFILIQKAKNGDKKAFEIVMTKYYPRVHSALYAFTKSYEDAEDLTQQAFIKSWTALESFRGDSSFYTWVYRMQLTLPKILFQALDIKKVGKVTRLMTHILKLAVNHHLNQIFFMMIQCKRLILILKSYQSL